jgi:CRISPR/Cas system-associated protein Cas7 (RAMP superfamily)
MYLHSLKFHFWFFNIRTLVQTLEHYRKRNRKRKEEKKKNKKNKYKKKKKKKKKKKNLRNTPIIIIFDKLRNTPILQCNLYKITTPQSIHHLN